MINVTNYVLSLPVILLALFAVGALVMDRMFPPEWKWLNSATAFAGLLFTAIGVAKIQSTQAQLALSRIRLEVGFNHGIVVDDFAIFFLYLLIAGAVLSTMIVLRRARREKTPPAFFYASMLCATAGAFCTIVGFNLYWIAAGMLVTELAVTAMIGNLCPDRMARSYARRRLSWNLISLLVLIAGFVLLYRIAGSSGLYEIRRSINLLLESNPAGAQRDAVLGATALTCAGLILRIVRTPFYRWDYIAINNDQSSAQFAATSFISIIGSVATWAMSLHIFLWGLFPLRVLYSHVLSWAAVFALVIGAAAILVQDTTLPFVANCVPLHAGFMLLGLDAAVTEGGSNVALGSGLKGILIYLAVYVLINSGVLAGASLSSSGREQPGSIRSLFYRDRPLAIGMLVLLLSAAALPGFAGFFPRFQIYEGLLGSEHRFLAAALLGFSMVALVAVAQLALQMFKRPREREIKKIRGAAARVSLGIAVAATLAMGFFPHFFWRLAGWALHLS